MVLFILNQIKPFCKRIELVKAIDGKIIDCWKWSKKVLKTTKKSLASETSINKQCLSFQNLNKVFIKLQTKSPGIVNALIEPIL